MTTLPTLNLRVLTRAAFDQALAESNGHIVNAAKLLGISGKTAYNMAHRFGLTLPSRRPQPVSDEAPTC